MNPIECRNRYIRAKAYRIACDEVGFVKKKVHDSWMSEPGKPVYRYDSVKHPDFDKVKLREMKRLRAALVSL